MNGICPRCGGEIGYIFRRLEGANWHLYCADRKDKEQREVREAVQKREHERLQELYKRWSQ